MDWWTLDITADKFLNLENLEIYSLEETINILGIVINDSYDNNQNIFIDKCISLFDKLNLDIMPSSARSILYYNIANAWDYKHIFTYTTTEMERVWDFEQPYREKQIFYLRSSIKEPDFGILPKYQQCLTFTNLANTLDAIGRFIEAIEYWNKAISIDENFGMALGNMGIGLESYAKNLYDKGHLCIFLKSAAEYYKKAVNYIDKMHEDYTEGFNLRYQKVHEKLPCDSCNMQMECVRNQDFELGNTQEEVKYRQWCLNNTLFLNPINDLGPLPLGARDIITTPNMVTPLDVGPRFQGFYNQMKQEFVSARYIFYESYIQVSPHFSDKDVLLYDTLDLPCYGLSIENTKNAYRTAYGILDKIAFFINEYFCFARNKNSVFFKTIWFEKGVKNKGLSTQLQNRRNLPLRALYWLSKDLFDDKQGFKDLVEPDAKDLYEIRNHLEHKYLKIHDLILWDKSTSDIAGLIDDLAYSVERNDFERKTIYLLRLVRNALIYLSLSIHVEELQKEKTKKDNRYLLPMVMSIIDDKEKK